MTYELAKQLKDAGFPQPEECVKITDGSGDYCRLPTLSELIEACGNRFEELNRIGHHKEPRWVATTFPCEECGWTDMHTIGGSTPEEAVAKLYLELHKNDKN